MDGKLENMQSLTGKIKSLEIDTTLTKKGMCAEAKATGEALAKKVNTADIVDELTSVASDKPLSANQGRVLKKQIDEIDPHFAENVVYDESNVKDALDKTQGAIDELKGTIGYTSKNLLKYPYVDESPLHNGVTWTDNGDGTITGNGTSTGQSSFTLKERTANPLTLEKGKYILSGCPQGGGENTYCLLIVKTSGSTFEVVTLDDGNGAEFTLDEKTNLGIYCMIYNTGVKIENLVFKPMIRYASIQDDTYEPYVADVQTKVNRLYDVETISKIILVATTTELVNGYTYTATKKCIINISASAYYSNSVPKKIEIKKNNNSLISANGYYGSSPQLNAISTSAFSILEKGETINVNVAYQSIANNNIHISGYVQYLE